jgi:hypothetical protein
MLRSHTTIDKLFIQLSKSSNTETGEACCVTCMTFEQLKCEHEYFLSGMSIHC